MRHEGDVKLRKSEHMDDWYVIEKAEHEHTSHWDRVGPNAFSLSCSSRISDACVEGPLAHMAGIAKAVRYRGRYFERRCAVDATGREVLIWSPRNSTVIGSITHSAARGLAGQIEELLQAHEATS
jgi:hypothetical protein